MSVQQRLKQYLDKWSETAGYGKSAQEETRCISERDSETYDCNLNFPAFYHEKISRKYAKILRVPLEELTRISDSKIIGKEG